MLQKLGMVEKIWKYEFYYFFVVDLPLNPT